MSFHSAIQPHFLDLLAATSGVVYAIGANPDEMPKVQLVVFCIGAIPGSFILGNALVFFLPIFLGWFSIEMPPDVPHAWLSASVVFAVGVSSKFIAPMLKPASEKIARSKGWIDPDASLRLGSKPDWLKKSQDEKKQ
jgi:hypothetical protein